MLSHRYILTLSESMDRVLCKLAEEFSCSKGEVLRRALVLLKHAVNAKKVKLVTRGRVQMVSVR